MEFYVNLCVRIENKCKRQLNHIAFRLELEVLCGNRMCQFAYI